MENNFVKVARDYKLWSGKPKTKMDLKDFEAIYELAEEIGEKLGNYHQKLVDSIRLDDSLNVDRETLLKEHPDLYTLVMADEILDYWRPLRNGAKASMEKYNEK